MKHMVLHLQAYFPFLGENGCDPTVEVYLPDNLAQIHRQNVQHPCLLICPGGAYALCSDCESEPVALHFLAEGFNVFTLTYSVAPHCFPTQLREVAALLELIHANAQAWHCDLSRITLMGFSAGGHLAAHYATQYDCEQVRAVFPQSKPVAASVLAYPVITADPRFTHAFSMDNLCGTENRTPEEVFFFSCECNVRDTTPPAFLWHTAQDPCVPAMNSILYAAALAEHRIPFELHVYPVGTHGVATSDVVTNLMTDTATEYTKDWLYEAKKWLNQMGFGYSPQ